MCVCIYLAVFILHFPRIVHWGAGTAGRAVPATTTAAWRMGHFTRGAPKVGKGKDRILASSQKQNHNQQILDVYTNDYYNLDIIRLIIRVWKYGCLLYLTIEIAIVWHRYRVEGLALRAGASKLKRTGRRCFLNTSCGGSCSMYPFNFCCGWSKE